MLRHVHANPFCKNCGSSCAVIGVCTQGPMFTAYVHAQVYKAQWRVQTVAVKMLSNTTAKQMEGFKREALILEDLKDTNIVQFMGACFEDSGDSMLVTEFMAGGNLFDAIGNDRDGKLGWYQR